MKKEKYEARKRRGRGETRNSKVADYLGGGGDRSQTWRLGGLVSKVDTTTAREIPFRLDACNHRLCTLSRHLRHQHQILRLPTIQVVDKYRLQIQDQLVLKKKELW